MANINVGELIVVNKLPTQDQLNNKSITVAGITKTFKYPVVFRRVGSGLTASVDYTYRNAVDAPISSFNPDLSFIQGLNIVDGELLGIKSVLTIPDSVDSVGDLAFYEKRITSLFISDSVTRIGLSAFEGNQLTILNIPSSVISIEDSAFVTNNLTAVTLPDNCTYKSTSFDPGVVITGGILIT